MRASDALPARFNAASHFVDRNVAEDRGLSPAFFCEGRNLTYGDLQVLVNRTGNALRGLGVRVGDRVLMICLDAPEFLGTFWGAIKIGAVPVPVNTLLRGADYLHFLNDSGAKAAVVSAPLLAEAASALGQATHLEHVLVAGPRGVGGGRSAPPPQEAAPDSFRRREGSFLSWEDHVARASESLEAAETSRDDPAFWLYSSGSTGAPKGAVHLQHDMVICAETYAKQVLGIRPTDRVFSAAKLFFAYGLGNAGYFPLSVGAQSILFPARPTPEAVFEVISRRRPTLFFAVPTLYTGMLAVADAERRFDLSSLRLCVSAGEALPSEMYARWLARFGVEIIDGMGTTELLHMCLSNRPGAARPGSSGVPVPGYEAAIVDDAGVPVPRGEIGSLRVKGDSIMASYWNQPEKTAQALRGDWLLTGDKYTQDEDGYYWYCGRSDDMLKVGGIWVSPVEVEATLIAHPAVLESAVVGHEAEDGLVKAKAYVVLKEPARASAELAAELQSFVKAKIAPYKAPRWIEFVDDLPKTATGKIQRFRLRAR